MADPAIPASLREQLRAAETSSFRRRLVLPFGIETIDSRLTDGGFRLDSLHEIAGAGAHEDDECAATLFAAGLAGRAWGPILWVVRRRDLFAPRVAQAGLDPKRIIYAEASDDTELLAIMEEGLRHQGLGAVIGEVQRISTNATRQLQRAAEGGRTIALLLKRHGRGGSAPLRAPSAAVTRWQVGRVPSESTPLAARSRARWQLTLVHQREGESFEIVVEACDASGRCALPAPTSRPGPRTQFPRAAA